MYGSNHLKHCFLLLGFNLNTAPLPLLSSSWELHPCGCRLVCFYSLVVNSKDFVLWFQNTQPSRSHQLKLSTPLSKIREPSFKKTRTPSKPWTPQSRSSSHSSMCAKKLSRHWTRQRVSVQTLPQHTSSITLVTNNFWLHKGWHQEWTVLLFDAQHWAHIKFDIYLVWHWQLWKIPSDAKLFVDTKVKKMTGRHNLQSHLVCWNF